MSSERATQDMGAPVGPGSSPSDPSQQVVSAHSGDDPSRRAKYIARCSYGNDSIAMLQLLREHGLKDVTVVYSDTGWASPTWMDRVEQAEAWVGALGWQAVRIASQGFEDLVRTKTEAGMFPTRMIKFCTERLKIRPFLKWVGEFDPDKRAIICVGVRRSESKARRAVPIFMPEQDSGRHVWHPIAEFNDADRDAMILKTPFPVLPHRSDECEICINSNRADLRRASEFSIERLERLEAQVGRPMFDPKDKMGANGIREVIRWAQSERGKYQPEQDDLFGSTCEDAWCGS